MNSLNTRLITKKELLKKQMNDHSVKASDIDIRLITGYKSLYNCYIKRIFDVLLALIIFIFIFPIYMIVSVAIVLEDGFPILYKAERGGYNNKTFKICKFRSMIKNADKIGGGTTSLNDNRITKIGSIIRKLKVDELPNLINVIKGEMSFIGPRPELSKYTNRYKGSEKYIFKVRPGMTDYSSIEFINLDEIVGKINADENYETLVLPQKNKLRVKYAATVSFGTDVKLFFLTIYKVIEKGTKFLFKKHNNL